ncbi:MAG: NAD(P)-dependent oxidoreductase [Dehalococcoidia bacterium]|nr:NAD(P)-dependent oxidoreductase [Dehalococcoidia bacterium]
MLKERKVLVTGLTGQLAGTIAYELAPHNDVWGLARYTRSGQREYWDGRGVHTVVGDYASGNYDGLPDDFDYVIHAAADTNPKSFESGMYANAEGPGLLMAHCQKARAFMHISATGVYAANPDPNHRYREDDLTGAAVMGHYDGTKLAGEGAVRATARYLNLPTVICRLGVQYGTFGKGGLLGVLLKVMLDGHPVPLPKKETHTNIIQPISNDDVVEFLEPLLNAATVPALTVNLAGDEVMALEDIFEHFGKLASINPKFVYPDGDVYTYPTVYVDATLRQKIAGYCRVPLRDGLTRMYEGMHEKIRKGRPVSTTASGFGRRQSS